MRHPKVWVYEDLSEEVMDQLKNPAGLYKNIGILNPKSIESRSQRLITEIVSEIIVQNIGDKEGWPQGIRVSPMPKHRKNYLVKHKNTPLRPGSKADSEENIAKRMFEKKRIHEKLGKVIDFQTPIKEARSGGQGKVDLITYNPESNTAWLVEFKKEKSPESLLRAYLEIVTYGKQIDHIKLKKEITGHLGLKGEPELRLAILLPADSEAWKNKVEMENGEGLRGSLNKLIRRVGPKVEMFQWTVKCENSDGTYKY